MSEYQQRVFVLDQTQDESAIVESLVRFGMSLAAKGLQLKHMEGPFLKKDDKTEKQMYIFSLEKYGMDDR